MLPRSCRRGSGKRRARSRRRCCSSGEAVVDADHVLVVADGDMQLGLVGAVGELMEAIKVVEGRLPTLVVAGD